MIEHVWEDALLLLCLKHDILCSLQVSPGDTGWDVFSLDYHVDGPIATVTHTGSQNTAYPFEACVRSGLMCCCLSW